MKQKRNVEKILHYQEKRYDDLKVIEASPITTEMKKLESARLCR